MRLKRATLGVVYAVALVGGSLAITATSASAEVVEQVTICHRTNANSNPYVEITPDVAGVLDGHADHTGPLWDPTLKAQHIKWGDIIPPFDMNGDWAALLSHELDRAVIQEKQYLGIDLSIVIDYT